MNKANEIIEYAAKGDKAALAFMTSWLNFSHLVDDLQDKDKDVTQEKLVGVLCNFILNVSSNPFYQEHRNRFESLIEQSASAWVDSDTFKKRGDPKNGIIGDTIKGFYHEVIYHAARIIGGWEHGRETAKRFRDYDIED